MRNTAPTFQYALAILADGATLLSEPAHTLARRHVADCIFSAWGCALGPFITAASGIPPCAC